MRILFYTMNWYPFQGSIQPIYGPVLKYLRQQGHDITILTSIPYFLNGRAEDWPAYRGKFFCKETWEQIPVMRTFVLSPRWLRRFSKGIRLLNFASFIMTSLICGIFLRRFDVVMTISHPPLFIGLNSFIIGRIKRCRYIYCLQDIFPDILVDLKIIKPGGLLTFLKRIESLVNRTANKICVLSTHMRDNLLSKGVDAEKIELIPHFADLAKIVPGPRQNPFAAKYALESLFAVLLPGSLSYGYEIDAICDSAKLLLDNKKIRFVFVDRGEFREALKRRVASDGLKNIQFVPFQPADRFGAMLASSDVCLVPHGSAIASYSIPSKVYNIMASARPVIAITDRNSELARIISQAGCGVTVPPGNPVSLAEQIKELAADKRRCTIMGENGRKFVEQNLHPDSICEKYEKLIFGVAAS